MLYSSIIKRELPVHTECQQARQCQEEQTRYDRQHEYGVSPPPKRLFSQTVYQGRHEG